MEPAKANSTPTPPVTTNSIATNTLDQKIVKILQKIFIYNKREMSSRFIYADFLFRTTQLLKKETSGASRAIRQEEMTDKLAKKFVDKFEGNFGEENRDYYAKQFENAAKAEKEKDYINQLNTLGQALLHIKSREGVTEEVVALCERGAEVNLLNIYGESPLHIASKKGHADVVQYLCARGAEVNQADNEGWTPLHFASARGHADVVKTLCDRGADVNLLNKHNESALSIASYHERINVIKILVDK